MNEKLKRFLDIKKEEERKKYEDEKERILIELGLYEKVYSPDNSYNEEYYFSEWDSANSINRYYKKVPVEITDEEYFELKKYSKKEEPPINNPIFTALTAIAWIIFIGGFIAGIALGMVEVEIGHYYTDTEFSFAIALVYWGISLISGTMVLGFAEIIKLLDAIKKK